MFHLRGKTTKHKQLVDFSFVLLLKDNSTRSLKSGFDMIFARVTAIEARNDRCDRLITWKPYILRSLRL